MMHLTFLGHSGFLVETESLCLLFDWSQGELPPLPAKPLLVFASHGHQDHFLPRIFKLDDAARNVTFFLGSDLQLTDSRRQRWNVSDEICRHCRVMKGGDVIAFPGVTVKALSSTDEGVAFLVTCDGKVIYHAGDLNWWHWEGEAPIWNRNMEADFKRYIEPLRGQHIDLAFAPLDHRQENAADWGFRYLLELADVVRIVPMHQWGNPAPTRDFCRAYPAQVPLILPMETPGQSAELPL